MLKISEKRASTGWKIFILVLFSALLVISFFVSNSFGTMKLTTKEIIKAIFVEESGAKRQVIWNIRLPRTIVACLVGMNLALSGTILQGIMGNPLADPHIIGISSGAGLAGILILVVFPEAIHLMAPAAFFGAIGASALIYALAWKNGIKPTRIILAGVAVSALLGAGITTLMVFFSDRVHGAIMFMAGGLSARSWPHVKIILPYTIIGMIAAFIMSDKLDILLLGDDVARGLGLNVERTRLVFTAIAALLAASAVCVAGLLGFVGLIIPHISRIIIGSNHKYLFPASALLGGGVLTLCDTFARTIFSPVEIPVGVVMAALGAPFFLYLLRKAD